ncbi:unnamed protein product [Alopecurus aequalis]
MGSMMRAPWVEEIMLSCLPGSPVSADASLFAAISGDGGGEDRISALPDSLLCNVVSRLPVQDGARTGALSHRWRGIWRATPLVLVDAHLFPDGGPVDWLAPTGAVSRILASHPGPFRCVLLANHQIDYSNKDALADWLRLLADKGVENLTLVNRPFTFNVPLQLPLSLLYCGASLRRLYLGVWIFPFTTGLPRYPDVSVFPHLQELGICHGLMEERDLQYVLACSPKLEILAALAFVGGRGYAPELFVLGYLDTAKHVLEIGNTIIKAGVTEVSPNTVVPTVKVLALKARFRVAEEVRTLLSFLRCSPEVETLYIMASDNDIEHYDDPGEVKPRDKLNSTFWQGFVPIKCVQSRVKKVVFDQFSGGTNQFGFLKMVLRKAVLLQKVIVLLAGLDSVKASEATRKLRPVVSKRKWASKVMDEISLEVRGRAADHVWSQSIAV